MSELLVQKYGGTSVGSIERINKVADNIKSYKDNGTRIVVVVSAMGKRTDKLLGFASEISENPSRREIDVLLSSGEQVTCALLSMALHHRNVAAHSCMGWQIPISTDSSHNKARITKINTPYLKRHLDKNYVVIVPGFQGVSDECEITTLGRGGSDTTAVALAAALKADECQIYTDVDGIYTADPRIETQARLLERITMEEMLELAGLGSKVLHSRSVSLAANYKIPLRVLSSFKEGSKQQGTLVVNQEVIKKGNKNMEQKVVAGIAHSKDEAKISVIGVADIPGVAAKVLTPLSEENIEVDMIVQNVGSNKSTDLTFTVSRSDYKHAKKIVTELAEKVGAEGVKGDTNVAKVSIVGLGMKSHAGVAAAMFQTLAKENINIQLISTSEIKVSVLLDQKYLELAVRALHQAFKLNRK